MEDDLINKVHDAMSIIEEFLFKYTNGNEIKDTPKQKMWEFTDTEKEILRNIDSKYKYIARDRDRELYVYTDRPTKDTEWSYWDDKCIGEKYCLPNFKELFNVDFNTIKWEDEEPCEFREYLGE